MTIEENGIIFHSANCIFQYFATSNLKIYLKKPIFHFGLVFVKESFFKIILLFLKVLYILLLNVKHFIHFSLMPQDVIWTKAIFIVGLVFNQENTVILLTFMVLSTYVM